jgi:hypothetical protein
MFTRIAVLFSLFAVILGIWFTLPSLNISTKQVPQFSVNEDQDNTLTSYQKKTRKHTYDQSFNTLKPSITPAPVEQSNIAKNNDTEEIVTANTEYPNVYRANPNFVDTQTLKKNIASENPNISKDYFGREDKTPKIAYKAASLIKATKSDAGSKQILSNFAEQDSLEEFVDSSIEEGSTGVKVDLPFTVTFDRIPDNLMIDKLRFVPEVSFGKSLNGNVLSVTPTGMSRNTRYTFGIQTIDSCQLTQISLCQQKLSWLYSLSFQTDYKDTIIYGKSEEGRDLISNIYGKCAEAAKCKKIMLTGGIHGSESQSGDLEKLQSFIEQNPQEIVDKNKVIIIVPFANPDGTASNKRYNANDVNLNRNFPTDFVACDICGSTALSEKESKYLVDLTLAQKPNFLISFHSQWPPDGAIFRGSDTNLETVDFAKWVSERTGYPVSMFPDIPTIPGDQTVWAESQNIRSLIIESKSISDGTWDKNLNLYLSLLRDL